MKLTALQHCRLKLRMVRDALEGIDLQLRNTARGEADLLQQRDLFLAWQWQLRDELRQLLRGEPPPSPTAAHSPTDGAALQRASRPW